jgi:hypothetical protein
MSKTYDYYSDGMLRYSGDLTDNRLDRGYAYDHVGRVKQALSGAEARGGPATNDRPYNQGYKYDEFNHITRRTGLHWSGAVPTVTGTYSNDRNTNWQYDADGNLLVLNSPIGPIQYAVDAAGRPTRIIASTDTTVTYDGNGRKAKSVEIDNSVPSTTTIYSVRSSLLGGQVITELTDQGNKKRTFVYAGGSVLATQWAPGNGVQGENVEWEHRDPSGASFRVSNRFGDAVASFPESKIAELDPAGANMENTDPYLVFNPPPDTNESLVSYPNFGNPKDPYARYDIDGIAVSFDTFKMFDTPFLIKCQDCGQVTLRVTQSLNGTELFTVNLLASFRAYGDGSSGYVFDTAPLGGGGDTIAFSFASSFLPGDEPEKSGSSKTSTDFGQFVRSFEYFDPTSWQRHQTENEKAVARQRGLTKDLDDCDYRASTYLYQTLLKQDLDLKEVDSRRAAKSAGALIAGGGGSVLNDIGAFKWIDKIPVVGQTLTNLIPKFTVAMGPASGLTTGFIVWSYYNGGTLYDYMEPAERRLFKIAAAESTTMRRSCRKAARRRYRTSE